MSTYRLDLPRWDTHWEIVDHYVSPKTGKLLPKKRRRVWDALTGNARVHWTRRHKAVQEVITAVVLLAKVHKVPACDHLTVSLHWAPGDRRRADVDNLVALQKVCCDGLARGRKDLPGLHLVPDDTPKYMTKLMPEIVEPPTNGLWLEVQTA